MRKQLTIFKTIFKKKDLRYQYHRCLYKENLNHPDGTAEQFRIFSSHSLLRLAERGLPPPGSDPLPLVETGGDPWPLLNPLGLLLCRPVRGRITGGGEEAKKEKFCHFR